MALSQNDWCPTKGRKQTHGEKGAEKTRPCANRGRAGHLWDGRHGSWKGPPPVPPEGPGPPDRQAPDFGPQDRERISLCCQDPPSSRYLSQQPWESSTCAINFAGTLTREGSLQTLTHT